MNKINIIAPILALLIQPTLSAVPEKQAQEFNMVVQKGHSTWINSLAFSPDGELIATGSDDNTIKLWTQDGRLIKTIDALGAFRGVSFSPDSRFIASSSDDRIQLWSRDGSPISTIIARRALSAGRTSIAVFSPDSKNIAYGTQDNTLNLWSLDGKLLRIIKHPSKVTSVSFSPEGEFLATGSADRQIRIWDRTGKLIRHFDADPEYTDTSRSEHYLIIQFSPDGSRIASGFSGNNGSVNLWTAKGKLIATLEKGYPYSISFSPDGKLLAVSSSLKEVIHIYGYDGKIKNSFAIKGGGAFFSPDGKYLGSASGDSATKLVTNLNLWTLDGKLARSFGKDFPGVWGVSLSPDGSRIAAGYMDETVKLWSLDGRLLRDFGRTTHTYYISRILFAPDGRFAVSMADRGKFLIKFMDVNGDPVSTVILGKNHSPTDSMAFSDDGKYLAVSARDSIGNAAAIELLTPAGLPIRTFSGHTDAVNSLSFSPDGNYLASGSRDGKIKIWSIKNEDVKTIEAGYDVKSLSFSPDGKFIVSAEMENGDRIYSGLKIWDSTGNLLRKAEGHGGHIISKVHFSQNGKYVLAVLGADINIWDLDKNIIKVLRGHIDSVSDAVYTPDSKNIISGSEDGTIRVWNAETSDSFSSVAADNGAEWVSYTSDGYFDASRNGGKLVAMTKGLVSYGVDQFAARNNRPDLILERAGVATPEQISHYYLQYQKRLNKMGLTEAALNTEIHIPDAKITGTKTDGKFTTVSFSLSDNKYPLKRYNLYVNDNPVLGQYGSEVSGNRFNGAEKLELTSGRNKIEVSAVNEAGAESYRALTYADYNDKVSGDLYYLAFGISKYKNPSLDLNYADKDVLDLQAAFSKMSGAYTNVYTKTILNEDATTENIIKAKDFIKNARVDDTVILFLAGHGGYDKSKDPKYYYLPYEADPNDPAASGVDFESIEDILTDIRPRKKLFLMDTCESGELDEDVYARYYTTAEARGFKPRTFRKPLKARGQGEIKRREYLYEKDRFIYNNLARRSGAIVFSSSRGSEMSYESSLIQNGFFSREIINALSSATADKNHDGNIDIEELREYVSGAVARDTAGLQNPTIDRDNVFQKISFPVNTPAAPITVTVYDKLGWKVKELWRGTSSPGLNSIKWDGKNESGQPVSTSVYIIKVEGGSIIQSKSVLVLDGIVLDGP